MKQQYGIHLATRLQSDDPGRQANWADIDDDDDDWAPESIEWTDGTKISLPSAEETAQALQKSNSPAVTHVSPNIESVKPKSPAPIPTSTVKLGGVSGISGRGLILKGASEKPTLVAKPPGPPTPVKSPWAPLPPVDKQAPIVIESPQIQQHQQSRLIQRDVHGLDAMTPLPAKEIAADDFSRSTWRDGSSHVNRELYNSQSGRYEPVNESRRASGRNEASGRQPALLQRPSHDSQGPAEPSAAFQTHRATGQDGSTSRRRASSNLSGGSGTFSRRLSKGQDMHAPANLNSGRRGSLVVVADEDVTNSFSPSIRHSGPRASSTQGQHASPVVSQSSPVSVHGQLAQPISQPDLQSDIELQKKIMRESREFARKRRLEQEAKEEAERKERIRLKLEAMGPAPESKKAKKETTKVEDAVPTTIQAREDTSTTISPPKPPVPEVAGEVKQYGMMKVHHPQAISTASTTHLVEDNTGLPDVRTNGTPPSLVSRDGQANIQQSWQNHSVVPTTWGAPASSSPQGRNVWGPPSNDKTLGNGTFNPELSRLLDIHSGPSNPGLIGPLVASNRSTSAYSPKERDQYSQRPAPIGPPLRNVQRSSQMQETGNSQATAVWANLPEELARQDALSREAQQNEAASRREIQTPGQFDPTTDTVFRDTWKKVGLSEDGTRSEVLDVSRKVDDGTALTAAAAWNSLPPKHVQAELARNEQLGTPRRDISGGSVVADTWRQAQLYDVMSNSVSPAARGSRFFPTRDVRLEEATQSLARPGSPSPPPPTMADHPAYDGDILHPHVLLPPPIARVRLPPLQVLAPIAPPKPVSFAAAVAMPVVPQTSLTPQHQPRLHDGLAKSNVGGPYNTRMSGDWQDRINSLVGKRTSPPKTHALAVDSSSKSALEVPMGFSSATVSLPLILNTNRSEDESSHTTKPLAEGCFEEQEMGSLPPVRLPAKAPDAAWHLAPPQQKVLPKRFLVSDVVSVDEPKENIQTSSMTVYLPGMTNKVTLPFRSDRQKSNPRKAGTRGGPSRHSSSIHPRGGKSRDFSNNYLSSNTESTSSNATNARGRGRGGHGSSWGQRHASSTNNAINA